MKRQCKRAAIFFTAALLCLSILFAAACTPAEVDVPEGPDLPDETGYSLVENGVSLYQIVIPQAAPAKISYAAKELNEFLAAATGAYLPVVEDAQAEGAALISIGETAVAEKLGVSVSAEEELGSSGYKIVTEGQTVCILSAPDGDGEGCIYGVYDFLEDAIGFRAYASDEIAYEQKADVPLYDYNEVADPSFDVRSIGYSILMSDQNYLYRMRLMDHYSDARWGAFGHTQMSVFLPASQYTDKEGWYNKTRTQICWSAPDEMVDEFAKNVEAMITNKPNAVYIMLGQEDNQAYCNCTKCIENLEKYGSYAGLQLVFLNRVVERVEAWREQNAPERDIRYVFFAYQGTLNAPVREEGGETAAYHSDCTPHEKLWVYFTPINADYSQPLESNINAQNYKALQDWSALMPGRLLVYSYDINFYNYFVNFNNFNTFHAHLQTYYDNGVDYFYSQGPLWSVVPNFSEMRIFVESQLMWDITKSYDALVDEFMAAYYKDAAEPMREMYDTICMHYAQYQATTGNSIGGIYSAIGTSAVWPETVVSRLAGCIERAMAAIEPLKNTDAALYSTLSDRIQRENLDVLYLQLSHYQSYFSATELAEMKEAFNHYTARFGMNAVREGGTLEGLFD